MSGGGGENAGLPVEFQLNSSTYHSPEHTNKEHREKEKRLSGHFFFVLAFSVLSRCVRKYGPLSGGFNNCLIDG